MILSHRLAIAFLFVLSGCAHKPEPTFTNMNESECTAVKFPTDAEFRAMRLSELYPWHQKAKESQDLIATAAALHAPSPGPCIKVAAFKGYTIIAEAMKYAY
jgi:hypothetical protein